LREKPRLDFKLNHKDRKDREENILEHRAAGQLDSVMDREEVARHIVDSAVAIHTALGPGLLESVYRRCLMYELCLRMPDVHAEYPIPIRYKEVVLDCGYRADLLVDECILVENRTVDMIHPVHRAHLLTYLKLSGRSIGFLINWKVPRIKDGIQRMIWHER
jgi:GxxExxY protein